MAENLMGPPYKDFLTCLLPEPRDHVTLCQRLEDSLFGCHLSDSESSGDLSQEGFSSTGSDESLSAKSGFSGGSTTFMKSDSPSRLVWRNSVSSLVVLLF